MTPILIGLAWAKAGRMKVAAPTSEANPARAWRRFMGFLLRYGAFRRRNVSSTDREPAIDRQSDPRHVTCKVRCQKGNGTGHFAGLAKTLHRNAGHVELFSLLVHVGGH